MPVAAKVGGVYWHDCVVGGADGDVAVAIRAEVDFGGLVGLQEPYFNLAERFGVLHQRNPLRTQTKSNTLARQAAPTNR